MTRDLFYALGVAILVLSDAMVWIRALRRPPKERRGEILNAILLLIVVILLAGAWLLGRR